MNNPDALKLKQMIEQPHTITAADVDAFRAKYPFFTLPAALLLKYGDAGALSPERKREMLSFIATNSPDLTAMQEYIDLDRNDWASIYPPVAEDDTPTTDNAISTFLDHFGSTSPKEEALLERLIFNPTPDYSQILEQEDAEAEAPATDLAAEDAQMARIDAFLAHEKEKEQQAAHHAEPAPRDAATPHAPVNPPTPPSNGDDSTLSESLAKIFIKQGRYERALEIITTLNLNYPKKSAYFADQLRFLQKLIKIEQARTQKSHRATP